MFPWKPIVNKMISLSVNKGADLVNTLLDKLIVEEGPNSPVSFGDKQEEKEMLHKSEGLDQQQWHAQRQLMEQQQMQQRLEQQRMLEEQQRMVQQKKLEQQRRLEEQHRLLQQLRLEEQKKLMEHQRLLEQQRLLEHQKLIEQKKLAEHQKLVEQRKLAEQQRLNEEQRLEEQHRLEEEQRLEEERRLEEQQRLEEERRLEEQQRLEELRRIEEKIHSALPAQYNMPNERTINVFQPMKLDSYNHYFVREGKAKAVNYPIFMEKRIMDKLASSLPAEYMLPNHRTLNCFDEMSADVYDHIFEKKEGTKRVFVDRNFFDDVIKSLPKDYILPDLTLVRNLEMVQKEEE